MNSEIRAFQMLMKTECRLKYKINHHNCCKKLQNFFHNINLDEDETFFYFCQSSRKFVQKIEREKKEEMC